MSLSHPRDPLHGITLETIVKELVERYGWAEMVPQLTLKGVLKTPKGDFVALLQAPDNKSYVGHSGDKVLDGAIKTITAGEVVFTQDVNDPLSLVKQREVRKTIRPEAR